MDNQSFSVNLLPLYLLSCGFQLVYKRHINWFPVNLGVFPKHIFIHSSKDYWSLPCARYCSRNWLRKSKQTPCPHEACTLEGRGRRQLKVFNNKLKNVISWCYRLNVLSGFSHVRLHAILRTVARRAPLSLGFSRQEYWSGLLCPPPGHISNPRIEPMFLSSTCTGRRVL